VKCDESTREGIRVKETGTGKEGKLVTGPAGVVWVKPTNSCWVLFNGESKPILVPCSNLDQVL
jgi:hypothetical protein